MYPEGAALTLEFEMRYLLILLCLAVTEVTAAAKANLSAQEIVPEFTAMGLKPQIQRRVDSRQLILENAEDQYFLSVQFGRLTHEQFQNMKAFYNYASQVPYSADREYDLVDFLPPAMQAVANQVFVPIYYNLSNANRRRLDRIKAFKEDPTIFSLRKSGLSDFTNCWNTTIEIIRNMFGHGGPGRSTYYLYWPGRWDADIMFSEAEFSDSVSPAEAGPGDVLTVDQKGPDDAAMLQHTAILISKNLVFERTDSTENDAYRISLRKDVESKYKRVFGEELAIDFRRFGGAGKKKFEEPPLPSGVFEPQHLRVLKLMFPGVNLENTASGCETGLGGGCDPTINVVHKTEIAINPGTGRGILVADQATLKRFIPLKAKKR